MDRNINTKKIMQYNKLSNRIRGEYQNTAMKGIMDSTEYGTRDTMLKLEQIALEEARKGIYENDKRGKSILIGDKEKELKAKKQSTSKGLLLLPVVGWVIFLALYWHRSGKLNSFRKYMIDEVARQNITRELLNNPCFLKDTEQYVDKLKGKDKDIYKKCIEQAFKEINTGKYDEKLEILLDDIEKINQANGKNMVYESVFDKMFNINTEDAIKFFKEKPEEISEIKNIKKRFIMNLDQDTDNNNKKIKSNKLGSSVYFPNF